MSDTIIITYWEGDEIPASPKVPFTKLIYAEWSRNGRDQHAHADEDIFDPFGEDGEGVDEHEDGEVRGIPEDVRETLALLIAPSLRAKLPASSS